MNHLEIDGPSAGERAFLQFSREERALYNPAFIALVVCRAVQGHQERFGRPCPLPVALLASVMALQPAIRRSLPKSIRNGLIRWLEENKGVKAHMLQNATALAGVTRPGMVLALHNGLLTIDENGELLLERGRLTKKINGATEEIVAIQTAAHLLGRWLPSAGSLSTVMALLGVRP